MGKMSAAGGLTKGKLELATATVGDVISGKKFYSGDKTIKTGTLVDLGYEPLATGGVLYEGAVYFYVGENGGTKRWALTRGVAMPQNQVASIIGLTADKMVVGNTVLGISGTNKGYDAGYSAGHDAGYSAGYGVGKTDGINSCYITRTTRWVDEVMNDANLKGRPFSVEVQTKGTGQPTIILHFNNGTNITL